MHLASDVVVRVTPVASKERGDLAFAALQIDATDAQMHDVSTRRHMRWGLGTKRERLGFVVSKWGNSLAVRIPVDAAKKMGVHEGDTLIAEISAEGRLVLEPRGSAIPKSEVRRLRNFLSGQKETAAVVADMRQSERY